MQGLVPLQEVSDTNQSWWMTLRNLSEMVSCGECNSTDVDIEENFCNECGEELQEEAEEEKLIVVGVIREVLAFQTNKFKKVIPNIWRQSQCPRRTS